MASPPSAAAAKMFHLPTIPNSNSCSATAGRTSGKTGGHAKAWAPRAPGVALGGPASGPPTRPSAMSRSALRAFCGIETRSEGWTPAASGRNAQPNLAERGALPASARRPDNLGVGPCEIDGHEDGDIKSA
eukprot:2744823-Pleurochrysis_carterae.AAC.1